MRMMFNVSKLDDALSASKTYPESTREASLEKRRRELEPGKQQKVHEKSLRCKLRNILHRSDWLGPPSAGSNLDWLRLADNQSAGLGAMGLLFLSEIFFTLALAAGEGLPRSLLAAGFEGALGEIHLLVASGAGVLLVEFVGEDLQLLPAFRALALERLKGFELGKSRAMLGCGHGKPPLFKIVDLKYLVEIMQSST
jgi:hypothetical protein